MKKLLIPVLIIAAITISSCCNKNKLNDHLQSNQKQAITNLLSSKKIPNTQLVNAVLYTQKAAEYKALCYQSFQLAKLALDKDLADKGVMNKRAIILDIDETVLDNSPYEATCVIDSLAYPEKWSDWCNAAKAKAIPGVVDFLKYVKANAVEIYYISNRKEEFRQVTRQNLVSVGLPEPDDDHLLLKSSSNAKEPRRKIVAEKHHISLLIGDNLADFSEAFDNLSTNERNIVLENLKNSFGRQFIILPNAMYGDWEGAIYNNDYSISYEKKQELLHQNLIPFRDNVIAGK